MQAVKRLLVLILLICLSVEVYSQKLNTVYQSMAEEDWEVALTKLAPYMGKRRKDPEVYWLAAICHMQRYRFEQSFEYFEVAKEFAEIDPFYYVPYAQAYLFSGNPNEAEKVLRKLNVQSLEPEFKADYLKVQGQIRNAKRFLNNPESYIVQNLGPNINSQGNEYSQVVTTDQRGIYFTARREGLGERADDGEYYEHIMQSRMNEKDKWVSGIEVKGYNTGKDFIAPVQLLDNDSTVVYFKNDDIYVGRLQEDGGYAGAEDLPINTSGWEAHANLYNDGNSIVFSSDRGNKEENADLYIAHKNAEGDWEAPIFLDGLNTKENEDAPFVAEDGTLYFSSRGHDSMGGYDIFRTTYDSAAEKFNAPINMGAPINMPGDDTFFTRYGQFAYFSSSRANGFGENDIYRTLLFEASKLQGRLMTCERRPLADAKITITNTKTGKEVTSLTDANGIYFINTPVESDVIIKITRNGESLYDQAHNFRVLFRDDVDIDHDFVIGGCEVPEMEIYLSMKNSIDLNPLEIEVPAPVVEEMKEEIEVVIAEVEPVVEEPVAIEIIEEEPVEEVIEETVIEEAPKTEVVPLAIPDIKLPIVYFDFDKSNVKDEFFKRLNQAARLLVDRRDLRINVGGHTDSYGSNPYNVALGQRRADAVIKYLVAHGVNRAQMVGGTFSEDVPIETNKTTRGRAFNRRVELSFIVEE